MADTPTILIIDHDADVRTSLQQHLQDHSNYQTHKKFHINVIYTEKVKNSIENHWFL